MIKYFADKTEVKITGSDSNGDYGIIYTDGIPLVLGSKSDNLSVNQPSYILTHGRNTNCGESSILKLTLFKLKNIKATLVKSKKPSLDTMQSHDLIEFFYDVDGIPTEEDVYASEGGGFEQRKGYYERHEIVLDDSYNIDWWKIAA